MQKKLFLLFILFTNVIMYGQEIEYNLKKGCLAEGYDLISYFNQSPKKGNNKFSYEFEQIKILFSCEKNLELFKLNPKKYLPQYGGWCAYAMGKNGTKVAINPKSYEIRNGKLYLFYNSWGTNTLKLWLEENPNELVKKATKNWKNRKFKKDKK